MSSIHASNARGGASRWSTIRNVVNDSKQYVNPRSSMTDQERQFLHLLSKSKAKTTQQEKKDTRTDTLDSFSQVVNAAVARAKLRQELSVHLSKLTASEAQFLKDLVDNEDVTQQQLEFAHNVHLKLSQHQFYFGK